MARNSMGLQKLKRIYSIAVYTKMMHWIAAISVILILFSLIIVGPIKKETVEINQKALEVQSKVEKIQILGQGEADVEQVLIQLNDEFRSLKTKVLKRNEQAKVISFLSQTVEDLKIEILNIAPQPYDEESEAGEEEVAGPVKIQPVYFRVELLSRYKTLAIFFERLKEAPLLFGVKNFTVNVDEKLKPFLQVDMTLVAYEEWTV
jgi:hypothetical protein